MNGNRVIISKDGDLNEIDGEDAKEIRVLS